MSRGYLAATLDAFGARRGMDFSRLATWLGCAAVDLAALRNQVRPDPSSPSFEADVQRLARVCHCRSDRLRELLEDTSARAPVGCAQPACPQCGSLRCKNCRQVYCLAHATVDRVHASCIPCRRVFSIEQQELYRDSERTKTKGMVCMVAGASLAFLALMLVRDYPIASLTTIAMGMAVAVVASVIAYRAACESAYRKLLK